MCPTSATRTNFKSTLLYAKFKTFLTLYSLLPKYAILRRKTVKVANQTNKINT